MSGIVLFCLTALGILLSSCLTNCDSTESESSDTGEQSLDGTFYLGCYNSLDSAIRNTTAMFKTQQFNMEKSCSEQCVEDNFSVSLAKGVNCLCVGLEDFTHSNLERIVENYCDFPCYQESVRSNQHQSPNNHTAFSRKQICGGNFGFSVLCSNKVKTESGANCSNSQLYKPLPINDTFQGIVQPEFNYSGPSKNVFECAEGPEVNSFRVKAYFPNNSPQNCSRFCMSQIPINKEKIRYALLGKSLFYRLEPHCFCETETYFRELSISTNCNETCPGDRNYTCGGNSSFIFTVYDIETPEKNQTAAGPTAPHPRTLDPEAGEKQNISDTKWLKKIVNGLEAQKSVQTLPNFKVQEDFREINENLQRENYDSPDIPVILSLVSELIEKSNKSDAKSLNNVTEVAVDAFANMARRSNKWSDLNETKTKVDATLLLNTAEATAFNYAGSLNRNQSTAASKIFGRNPEFKLTAGLISKEMTEDGFTVPIQIIPNESFLELPQHWGDHLNISSDQIFAGTQIGGGTDFVETAFGNDVTGEGVIGDNKHINSNIMALTLKGGHSQENKSHITFRKGNGVKISHRHSRHQRSKNNDRTFIRRKKWPNENPVFISQNALCAFWDEKAKIWSTEGCKMSYSNESFTTCECNHLTAFALLVDVNDYVGLEPWLEVLTLLISPVAVLCLGLGILVMTKYSVTIGVRNVITINLCSCLMAVNLLVLFVVDRNYFYLSELFCGIVGATVHYVMLSALFWMAMEGVLLYKKTVRVFDRGEDHLIMQHLICYGVPLLLVGLNGLIGFLTGQTPYGGDEFCYLEGNFKFSFTIPMAIIVVGNTVVLVKALRIAYNRGKSTLARNTGERITLMRCVRSSIFVSCLLGVTWIAGFIMLINNYTISTIGAYIFTILNASQGVLIFAFQFKSNEQLWNPFRNKILEWTWRRFQSPETTVQYTSYTWPGFSNSTTEEEVSIQRSSDGQK